jgi:predicted Zn-dependent protease
MGGVLDDAARQQRAEAVALRLAGHDPMLQVKVHVLCSDAACAFAWPDRTVYLTRGLIDRADDAILAAAVAHEMGHLLKDQRSVPSLATAPLISSLHGCDADTDAEFRADAVGIALLREKNLPSDAMARMLRLVRDSNALTSDCRRAMERRIQRLTTMSAAPQVGQ